MAEAIHQLKRGDEVTIKYHGARHLKRVARATRRDIRIAVAVSANPRAEAQEDGHVTRAQLAFVDLPEGVRKLLVESWQRGDQRVGVVIEAHLDLVAHGGRAASNLVRLPERGDLCRDRRLLLVRFRFGQWQLVDQLKALADAPSLEEDGAARDLRRVRGEDRDDFDSTEVGERLLARDTGFTNTAQRAPDGAGLRWTGRRELCGAASALAMTGLCQVGQLEVDGERLRHPVGFDEPHPADDLRGALHQSLRVFAVPLVLRIGHAIAVLDRKRPQFFDRIEERLSRLLLQDLAEQATEETHITTQRRVLDIPLAARQLNEPQRLIVSAP